MQAIDFLELSTPTGNLLADVFVYHLLVDETAGTLGKLGMHPGTVGVFLFELPGMDHRADRLDSNSPPPGICPNKASQSQPDPTVP